MHDPRMPHEVSARLAELRSRLNPTFEENEVLSYIARNTKWYAEGYFKTKERTLSARLGLSVEAIQAAVRSLIN